MGQDASASSLALAKTYTVHLLTSCASDDSDTTCTKPRIGFHFDPAKDLKLESTSIVEPDLKAYPATSSFLGVAYIFSLILNIFSIIFTLVRGNKFPRAGLISAIFSSLSTLFLFAADIAALVTYKKLKSDFDDSFSSFGIETSLGRKLFILSWVADIFSLATTIYLIIRARRPVQGSQKGQKYSDFPKGGADVLVTGGTDPAPSALKLKKASFLSRVPFLGSRGKYQQINKQSGKQSGVTMFDRERAVDHDNDWDPLVRREEEEESFVPDGHRGIAMQLLPGGKSEPSPKGPVKNIKDISTAYEPYRREDEPAAATGQYTGEQTAYDPHDSRPTTGYAL